MKNTILSLIRHLLSILGGAVIANNPSITDASASTVTGAVVAVVAAAWGAIDEYKAENANKGLTLPPK